YTLSLHDALPILGMPEGTAGVLVSGGSAANLTALLVAREAVGGPSENSVVYVSDQGHLSLARTARAMGLRSIRCGCCRPMITGGRSRRRCPPLPPLTAVPVGSLSPRAPAPGR